MPSPSKEWTSLMNDLGKELGSLEEHPFLSPKLKAYLTGNVEGTIPAGLKKLYLEELPKMMYQKGYAESHPQEALDLAATVLGAGTPFAEAGEATLGMVKAFHGSPTKFNKFSDEFIGSGTGGRVFGWGHYLSETEKVGEHYYKLGKKRADTTPSLFEVEALPGVPKEKENWLEWYNQVTDKQKTQINDQLQKEFGEGYLATFDETFKTGENVYRGLQQFVGSPRKVSKFLDRAGIHGIKYPVGSLNPGRIPMRDVDFFKLGSTRKQEVVNILRGLPYEENLTIEQLERLLSGGEEQTRNWQNEINKVAQKFGWVKKDYNYVVFNPKNIKIKRILK